VAAPALVLLAVSAETVLRIFHQPPSQARVAMLVLASAFLVDAFSGPVGHVLTMSGRSWLNWANNAVSLVCNVVLNLLLIPHLGLLGAAISWAVVIAGVNVVRILQVRRVFGVTPFSRSLAKPAVALGASAIVGIGTGHVLNALMAGPPLIHLTVVGSAFLATYAATLMLLGINADDRLLWRALRRPRSGKTPVATA
jgi:O-antigen/teichoic acid export membrane protein